jgi:DNA-binding response OmpR family regulator
MNTRLPSKNKITASAHLQSIAPYCFSILLVDDDIYTQELNAGTLIRTGYNVETADDGVDAWKALNARHYDLLITDHQMPRLTGLELIKKLRSADMKLSVILTPEKKPLEEFEPHPWLRLDATLPKPFTATALLNTVEKVLRATKDVADGTQRFEPGNAEDNLVPPTGQKGALFQIQTKFPIRILVVDDELLIRQLYAELLNDRGYEVDTAKNGAAAWEALQMNDYNLLVTDNEMPQLSGVELVKKLRAAHMTLPVIMVSGTMPTEELKLHPELHIDAAVTKPFNITELTDIVKKVLRVADGPINNSRLPSERIRMDDTLSHADRPAKTPLREQTNPSPLILVVDDDDDTRQISINLLVDSGYGVEGAKDGAAGWEAIQNADYDLIVTDNKMPRMTGLEMLEKMRAARMSLPVIMATGSPPIHEFERRPWLRPDLVLQRPFSNDDLVVAVKTILGTDDGKDDLKESLLPKYLECRELMNRDLMPGKREEHSSKFQVLSRRSVEAQESYTNNVSTNMV